MKRRNDRHAARGQGVPSARIAHEWQKTIDAVLDAIWILDKDQRIIRSNKTAQQLFKLSDDEMAGKYCREIVHGKTQPIPECPLLRVRKSLCRESTDLQIGHRWYAIDVDPILDADGGISGYVHIVSDSTERKQAEEALRRSNENLSTIMRTTPDASCITRLTDGVFLEINQAFTDITGYTMEELAGRSSLPGGASLWTKVADRDRLVTELKTKGEAISMEMSLRIKDGTIRTSLLSARVLEINGVQCILTIAHDITERKRMEEALYRSQNMLQTVLDTIPAAVFWKDRDSNYLGGNRAWLDAVGIKSPEAVIGKSDYDLPWERPQAVAFREDDKRVMESGASEYNIVEPYLRADGTHAWARTNKVPLRDFCGSVIGILGTYEDITETKRMEEELYRAQKLDSLGVLAGGIAHDFNNLLTGIFGYIDLARSISKDAKVTEYLESTLASMSRARALTLQLLTFAKGGAPVQKITALRPFIREVAAFALSGSNISCTFLLAENLWPCNIDKGQIGQVIENIVINAQQAMPNGGAIEITAENISFAEKEHPLLSKGDYAKVSIKDFGIGIPKDIMPRIFDPFYTTKTKGHGLGLATCYSIVNRHGGCIQAESEPGKGSTFHFFLPASSKTVTEDSAAFCRHKGSGTIIVMDDEAVLRDTFKQMLESFGYSVVCTNDGKGAVDFYDQQIKAKRRCVAMFFDLTIPGGMGGIAALREVRKSDTEIPVFVASGYSDDPVMKNPAAYGFTASISKPFTMSEIAGILDTYLKSRESSTTA